jgi:hypothetical protein
MLEEQADQSFLAIRDLVFFIRTLRLSSLFGKENLFSFADNSEHDISVISIKIAYRPEVFLIIN